MKTTCNLSTVKTPQAKRGGIRTQCYYIRYQHTLDDDMVWPYDSISKIMASIMEVLEYCDLEYINNATICAYKTDGSSEALYRIVNDVDNRCLTFIRVR